MKTLAFALLFVSVEAMASGMSFYCANKDFTFEFGTSEDLTAGPFFQNTFIVKGASDEFPLGMFKSMTETEAVTGQEAIVEVPAEVAGKENKLVAIGETCLRDSSGYARFKKFRGFFRVLDGRGQVVVEAQELECSTYDESHHIDHSAEEVPCELLKGE